MTKRSDSLRRAARLSACTMLALTIAPAAAAAQQELSPVQVEAQRVHSENARADTLEEYARSMYSSPRKFREAAQLHQRAAEIRGDDPRAAASYRSAALVYTAAGNNGMATQMMVRAAEKAAMSGRIEEAANSYIDAALLALEDNRDDKVPALLTRMYAVLSAPLLPEDRRTRILERIREDSRVALIDQRLRNAP